VAAGYREAEWVAQELAIAKRLLKPCGAVGVGFITWHFVEAHGGDQARASAAMRSLLSGASGDVVSSVWFSFGDCASLAATARGLGKQVYVQVSSSQEAAAVAPFAQAVVVQGTEAGGHGSAVAPGTRTLDLLRETVARFRAPDAPTRRPLILAAGGIVNASDVAACVALGADGVVLGTRLLPTPESLAHPRAKKMVLDARNTLAFQNHEPVTVRTSVVDHLRGYRWPVDFNARVLANRVTTGQAVVSASDYQSALARGDFSIAAIFVGSAVSRMDEPELHSVDVSAAMVVVHLIRRARRILSESLAKL
jgi:nitronate monooxygenase